MTDRYSTLQSVAGNKQAQCSAQESKNYGDKKLWALFIRIFFGRAKINRL
jgi:hypothetical protein